MDIMNWKFLKDYTEHDSSDSFACEICDKELNEDDIILDICAEDIGLVCLECGQKIMKDDIEELGRLNLQLLDFILQSRNAKGQIV